MSADLRRRIYEIDPNAKIFNSQVSLQGQSFDIREQSANTWSALVNPYNESCATITSESFFIFNYTIGVAAAAVDNPPNQIRMANNIILNGISSFSFNQGPDSSVYTFSTANIGRSLPCWKTFQDINNWNQGALNQLGQLQDATFIERTYNQASYAPVRPAIELRTNPINYNAGRCYDSLSAGEGATIGYTQDSVMVPLSTALAPTSQPLDAVKGVISMVFNFNFTENAYLNLLPGQVAANLRVFRINKCVFFFSVAQFSEPIPRPLQIKPFRVICNKFPPTATRMTLVPGITQQILQISAPTTQVAAGKLILFVVMPYISQVIGDPSYQQPDPYSYFIGDTEEFLILPNSNTAIATLAGNAYDTGLVSNMCRAFSIQNARISIDSGGNWLPSNSNYLDLSQNFSGMSNYIYSTIMQNEFSTSKSKSILPYDLFNQFFQYCAFDTSTQTNLGFNAQCIFQCNIYCNSLVIDGGDIYFDFDYFMVSIDV